MLWIPGPTHVRPELAEELTKPMCGHRSREMTEVLERIDPHLRLAFGIEEPGSEVAVCTGPATAMMEAALNGAGHKILSVVGGAFGRRFEKIARTLGKDVTTYEVEPGQVFDDPKLADLLDYEGPFDALTIVLNETSNGVFTNVRRVTEVLQAFPDTLLLADVVSLLGGAPLQLELDCIDFALAGVNKALALPPGISVVAVTEAYMERAREQEPRSHFLDPVRIVEGHKERHTPTTPCIPLYRALARQLEDISAGVNLPAGQRDREGADAWQARFDVHARMRDRTLAWGAEHGFEPFPVREACSPTVSCLRAGELDVARFLAELKARGEEIGNGYGALKNRTFRIGHMGDHTEAELEALLGTADEVLGALQAV